MSTDTKNKLAVISAELDKRKPTLAQALPKHITPERMVRVALNGILRQPKLLDCSVPSIVKSVMDASQLGLDCSGLLGEGYLVPYWNNRDKRYDAQFIPGYQGLISLARRSGQIKDIVAHLVYEGDSFKCVFGLNPVLEHTPNLSSERADADIVFVYAIGFLLNGTAHVEIMTRAEIDKIRDRSKSRDKDGRLVGPWVTDYAEQCRKTVVRRLAKYLPKSIEFAEAEACDNQQFKGEEGVIDVFGEDTEPALPEHTDPPKTKTERLKDSLIEGDANV